jgi:hypothetical protein
LRVYFFPIHEKYPLHHWQASEEELCEMRRVKRLRREERHRVEDQYVSQRRREEEQKRQHAKQKATERLDRLAKRRKVEQ